MAPIRASTCGTALPTAGTAVETATPNAFVLGSSATMENVSHSSSFPCLVLGQVGFSLALDTKYDRTSAVAAKNVRT